MAGNGTLDPDSWSSDTLILVWEIAMGLSRSERVRQKVL